MNKYRKLIVITSGSYPYGGAATNRHLSYLKGLVELGIEVKMLILQPASNQSAISNSNNGIYNGIHFQYMLPPNQKTNGIKAKVINKINSISKALKATKNEINKYKDVKILILLTDPFEIIPFLTLSRKKNIKIFHERTEYPFIGSNGLYKSLLLKLYLKIVKRFDGFFVITKSLKEYFGRYVDNDKIIYIPMTVEPERFNCKRYQNSKYGRYIAYCGSMYTDKDGVPILVDAFDKFAEKFDNINLILIGDYSNESLFSPIKKKIFQAKNRNRIMLTGQVDRDEMPELLCNADALALARPDNIQAKGGFPTKLGEYLSTGNPVIVTAVGEIPYYLINKKNAFVCEPNSVDSFLNAFLELYSNPQLSYKIGLEGKTLVYNIFNYKIQANKLKKFIFNA